MRRLTWRDLAATVCVLIAVAFYWIHAVSSTGDTFNGSRFSAGFVFLFALMADAVNGELSADGRYARVMAAAGGVVFALFVVVLVIGSDVVFGLMTALIVAMWLVSTVRHALGKHQPPKPIYSSTDAAWHT